jgi:Calcineurin-like phosphoesterase
MKKQLLSTALIAASVVVATSALAGNNGDINSHRPLTVAVFGDWPYNQNLLDNAPLLINSVNSDPDVSMVIHVGDIHSGSMACTSAATLPPITTSDPGWNQGVYHQFQQFKDPLVYTPGDNEWTDCHKSKEKSSGYPLKELASVRSLFFAKPGHTLGLKEKIVSTQARDFDPNYPSDAQFVENVMWEESNIVFVTLNIPGGSNDDDPFTYPWTGIFADTGVQMQEVTERDAANLRWLQAAFDMANHDHASAVVIATQADMWDPEAQATNSLTNYTPFIQKLADLSVQFRRPVLILNGDSHVYEADHPLADPASTTGLIHHTQPVPNLTRITVQGSTNAPAEWLKLTIDPRKYDVFSWENIRYCIDPLSSCQ